MAITYILYSDTLDHFYIGHTTLSIEERIKKHCSNHSGFTARAKDWKCVWMVSYSSKEEAYAKERELKKLKSRQAILNLIHQV